MLENLINLVKSHAGDAIINNSDIPNERNDEAIQLASENIFQGLQKAFSSGNNEGIGIENLVSLFSKGGTPANNQISQGIQNSVVQGLIKQFGLGENKAGNIASMLIPVVMNQLVNKTNDPNDNSFDLQDIFNKVSGGKTGGVDIGSLINQFSGNKDEVKPGSGLLDSLKGLFGR
jgi:hypothetical protein